MYSGLTKVMSISKQQKDAIMDVVSDVKVDPKQLIDKCGEVMDSTLISDSLLSDRVISN